MKKNQGQALIVVTVLFTIVSIVLIFGVTSPIVSQLKMTKNLELSKKSYFTAEAASEEAFYRIRNNFPISDNYGLALNNAVATVSINNTGVSEKEIISVGNASGRIRSLAKDVTVADGFSFNLGIQTGIGGLELYNNAAVIGNVYSGATIKAFGTNTRITGDVVSAGPSGLIDNITAFGNAYARQITGNSLICGSAYYQIINASSLSYLNNPVSPCPAPYTPGTAYPDSPNQPLVEMPISEALMDQWEADAASGTVINSPCPYIISSGTVTLGPVKINCNLEVNGNDTTVMLTGAVWVNGSFVINGNPKFKVSNEVGNRSVPIIIRSVASPTAEGRIVINNNPEFFGSEMPDGSANPDSYVMFISRNMAAEAGTGEKAIIAGNNIVGNLLLYASRGEIELSNNVILRGVTAYKLTLKNNVEVHYDIGLAQPIFTAGPGGTWKIKNWHEF